MFPNRGAKLVASVGAYGRASSPLGRKIATIRNYLWNVVCGSDVAREAGIHPTLRLPHPCGVVIHRDAKVGADCLIMQNVTLGMIGKGEVPVVEDGVYLGAGAKVIGRVRIGAGARVGANAVVLEDVPPGMTAVGVPARLLRPKPERSASLQSGAEPERRLSVRPAQGGNARNERRRDMAHQMNSLDDLYLNQLQDNYSANKQMAGIVGEFQQKASDEKLKMRLNQIKEGVQRHNETLKTVIEQRGGKADGEHCKGMEGLVTEGRAHGLEPEFGDGAVQDAAMIAQLHRMSHYGIAGFGTAKAFAEQLGYDEDAQKLDSSLGDIYDSEEFMSQLAEKRVNPKADR